MHKYICKKCSIIALLLLFFLVGFFMKTRKVSYEDNEEINLEQYIQLDSTHTVSQKLLGDDHYLTDFSVPVKEKIILEDSKVTVYLLQGSHELTDENIISQTTLTSDALQKDAIQCSFNDIRLRYNRDYYIVFEYEQAQNEGFLDLYISSSGIKSPAYINNINTGVPLAYNLKSISYKTQLFFLWKFVFTFMPCMAAYAMFRKKQLVDSFVVVPIILVIIVYLLAILGLLSFSVYVCMTIAGICFGYVMVKLFLMKKNEFEIVINKETIWQIICWGILFLLCVMGNRGKCVIESDPFTHWAFSVENIYMFDKLPFHPQSNMNNFRYPPLYSLFQYLCMKIYGNWSESILYFAKDFLLGSIIIGSCSSKRIKNAWGTIFALIIGIGIPELFFSSSVSACIYVDEVLGAVFGYALICLYKVVYKKQECVGELFIALVSLGLVKESGIILGAILISVIAFITLVDWIKAGEKDKFIIESIGISMLAIVLAYGTWHIYMALNISNVTVANVSTSNNIVAASGVSSNGIVDFLLGKASSYKYEVIGIHLQKLFFGGYYDNAFWSITFGGWLFILLLFIYCLSWINKNESKINTKIVWTICMAALLYIGFLHVVYTFTLPEREALMCASEDRYLGSFLLGTFMLVLYMYYAQIEASNLRDSKKIMAYVLLGVFVLVTTNQCMYFRQEITNKEDIYDYAQNIRNDSHKLRYFLEENDRVFYLADMGNAFSYMYYNYDLLPIRSDHYGFPVDESIWEPIYDLTVDELRDKMKDYEYVYIRTTRKLFNEKYGALFVDPNGIEDGSLYHRQADGLLVKVY